MLGDRSTSKARKGQRTGSKLRKNGVINICDEELTFEGKYRNFQLTFKNKLLNL